VEHVPDRNNQPNLNSTMFMELFVFMKSYEIPKAFMSVLQTLLIKIIFKCHVFDRNTEAIQALRSEIPLDAIGSLLILLGLFLNSIITYVGKYYSICYVHYSISLVFRMRVYFSRIEALVLFSYYS